ncbi:MAG TPA: hypothetical protein VGH97_05915 [Thermoanaerobaculia bacterium]|jgi:hypothetical protein
MVPRPSRIAAGSLTLLAVVALARCASRPCPVITDTLKAVTINKNSQASPADTYLYYSTGDTVAWVPYASTHALTITFSKLKFPGGANNEPPFAGGTNGQDQVFQSGSGTLYSPAINPALKALFDKDPSLQLIYPYDQQIGGVSQDGRIIIMK